jgi:hypothetical protein
VTLRRVRVTIVAVEKQKVLLIVGVSSFRYQGSNARAPYCHMWPARVYSIFQLYLTNGKVFEKKIQKIKNNVF